MLQKCLLLVLFACSAHVSCRAQSAKASAVEGGITGFVLTEDGQPAKGAKPCVSVRSGNNTSITCVGSADDDGRFTIERLKTGTYQVFAINEAEGYSIGNQSPGNDVTLTAGQPWVNVTVRLHSRGGILVGKITDKVSGRAIHAQIQHIALDKNGEGGTSDVGEGEFQVSVPPNCDLLVVVMAKGYKGWVYTESTDATRPVLRLAPGERKLMQVQLEPLPNN